MGKRCRFSRKKTQLHFLDKCESHSVLRTGQSHLKRSAISTHRFNSACSTATASCFAKNLVALHAKLQNSTGIGMLKRFSGLQIILIDGIDWTKIWCGACMVFMIGVALQTTIRYKVRRRVSPSTKSLTNLYSNATSYCVKMVCIY